LPFPAISFDVTFTGDNVIEAWAANIDGSWTAPLGLDASANNWQQTQTVSVNNAPWGEVSIYWSIVNEGETGGSGNPAGFLAEIRDLDPIHPISSTQGSLLSSAYWEVSTDFSTWYNATEWGANSDATIWNSVNGGPIDSIAGDAEWIWNGDNFSSTMDQRLYVRASIKAPEPASMLLLGCGLIGLAAIGRKKFIKK